MAFYAQSVHLHVPLKYELSMIFTPSSFRQSLENNLTSLLCNIQQLKQKGYNFLQSKNVKECSEKSNVPSASLGSPFIGTFPINGDNASCLPTGRLRMILFILNCSPSESDPAPPHRLFHSGVHYVNTEMAQWFRDFFTNA